MLRVLVAEDSATARLLITSLLASDPEITVVGQAKNGEEAVALASQLHPDVITMDIQMPVMDGLEATRRIVAESQTPVIMVSSLDPSDVARSMQAFNAGALAVLAKPSGPGTPRFEKDCRDLITTVKALSESRVASASPPAPPTASTPPEPTVPQAPSATRRAPSERAESAPRIAAVGIVASTGGPLALRTFFKSLPPKIAPPILIVQHIAAGFSVAFSTWLHTATGRTVKVGEHGEKIGIGTVYIAPDDHQLAIEDGVISLTKGAVVDGARPSGTVMLASLAACYGASAAGILLTGTGADGVNGLRAIRDAGGAVYAQDEASCTVADTPRAAVAAGIVAKLTPLTDIPHRLASLVAGKHDAHH